MYTLLVSLDISDFEAFEEFESIAVAIMADYGGVLLEALEVARRPDGSGEEIHLLGFTDEDSFNRYRQDPRLSANSALRARGIAATRIQQVLQRKTYPTHD